MATDDAANEAPDPLEKDEESNFAPSFEFWQMIEQRRREPTIPWEEAMRKLGL